ncbi:DUF305 domain-containing protein [Marinilactibacillus psychrotolerans]|uniref:DUF305 domain-containing protein n=2 Tax=Marinilactibacillus psychrotolerans TaxID=191770 RepID=A0AAV3WXU7_9LACT|nr:DUF305 domain-containing protein [Marinilactibacillus psychrotolerans]GEL67870.1 hypothetical protein MPS01_20250 [Marinilactibacillus psychrotolerans]GEQ36616.1 hypothetical protein M132T_21240 [Marinilactibacillus psychrotolerans]SDD10598.1 protein of unknown function [Marinilactibacillus psychrotolerans]SJN18737.1 Hypothetical protein involved in heavy metal export [Marinilactibacillus psychrotolerans 42ea]
MKQYIKFGLMILTSTVIMYILMFLNVFEFTDVKFSETRVYMAIMMGAVMAVIMILFMWKMYKNKKVNSMILAASIVVFGVSLWLVRSQTTVDDTSYMKAMIPHHSIAILTSERANISDPRVRELADGIIKTQKEEIQLMNNLIDDLEKQEDED